MNYFKILCIGLKFIFGLFFGLFLFVVFCSFPAILCEQTGNQYYSLIYILHFLVLSYYAGYIDMKNNLFILLLTLSCLFCGCESKQSLTEYKKERLVELLPYNHRILEDLGNDWYLVELRNTHISNPTQVDVYKILCRRNVTYAGYGVLTFIKVD